jgi:hypothetical protein
MNTSTEPTTHLEIAAAMVETVRAERTCITSLDLEGMAVLARYRHGLGKRALELAPEGPAPDPAKRNYRLAHRMALQNHKILQSAQQAVTTMLNQVMERHSPTYSARGRTGAHKALRSSASAWKG